MFKYYLRETLHKEKPDDYTAQVTDSQVFTLYDIIDRMVENGINVTRDELTEILKLYAEECAFIIKEGGMLDTPLMNTSMDISGVFTGKDDVFDKRRHTVNLNLHVGPLLSEAVSKIKCEKESDPNKANDILSYRLRQTFL